MSSKLRRSQALQICASCADRGLVRESIIRKTLFAAGEGLGPAGGARNSKDSNLARFASRWAHQPRAHVGDENYKYSNSNARLSSEKKLDIIGESRRPRTYFFEAQDNFVTRSWCIFVEGEDTS